MPELWKGIVIGLTASIVLGFVIALAYGIGRIITYRRHHVPNPFDERGN